MTDMLNVADTFDQNLGNWYIVLDSASIGHGDAPGTVGSISAQNSFRDGQNPVYGIGPGGDSNSFEISGSDPVLKVVPARDSYTVAVTSAGESGSDNSRTFGRTLSILDQNAGHPRWPVSRITFRRPSWRRPYF